MKHTTDTSPFPTLGDARQYLEAAGLGDFSVPGVTFALAAALYRLIGPDVERARTALRLLDIAEAADERRLEICVNALGEDDLEPGVYIARQGDVVYRGDLSGAEEWLRTELGE